ncbi:MAG TPA: iron-sulfur cluster repair di-iron protein [Chitinophagaceae bacterium]|nr:iron-sulfur cluster repair di-iron protein [Chitinophagaceae bacterium]
MNSIQNKTVAELVAEDIQKAHVFKKYGIDFCCGGNISVETATRKKGIDVNNIFEELENVSRKPTINPPYDKWNIGFLASYIEQTHHTYVNEAIPMLNAYAEKVCKVHAQNHPPLLKIKSLMEAVFAELGAHMMKEEKILFPYIKQMDEALAKGIPLPVSHFGSVNNPIHIMEAEHETAGNIFKEISELTNNYNPPEWACNTFKAFYDKLSEFEEDLHIHVHLENNILFPKAKAIEKKLSQ